MFSQLSYTLCSIRHPVEQDQELGERDRPGADHPLLEGEEPEEVEPLRLVPVLGRVRTDSSPQRPRPP